MCTFEFFNTLPDFDMWVYEVECWWNEDVLRGFHVGLGFTWVTCWDVRNAGSIESVECGKGSMTKLEVMVLNLFESWPVNNIHPTYRHWQDSESILKRQGDQLAQGVLCLGCKCGYRLKTEDGWEWVGLRIIVSKIIRDIYWRVPKEYSLCEETHTWQGMADKFEYK
jgi:hypothetical protein